MCLIGLRLAPGSDWPLIIAANRDEFHGRPTDPARWWPAPPAHPAAAAGRLLAGRDQLAGGTWLGLRHDPAASAEGTSRLRIGALTNIRPGLAPLNGPALSSPRSRGELVTGWLRAADAADPQAWLTETASRADRYPGFNLLAIEACWPAPSGPATPAARSDPGSRAGISAGLLSSAAAQRTRPLPAGLHLIANGLVGDDWPKARRLAAAMTGTMTDSATTAGCAATLTERLLQCLADRTEAGPGEQPGTGLEPIREQALSAIFIADPVYGTRASTVIVVDAQGRGWFTEQSWGPGGETAGRISETFGVAA